MNDLTRGYLGKTGPHPLEVRVAKHESLDLTFEKEGFNPVKRSVVDIRTDRSVMVKLGRGTTILCIESQPAGAIVQMTDTSGKPIRFINVSDPGAATNYSNQRYEIQSEASEIIVNLDKDAYMSIQKTVRILPQRINRCSFTMEQRFATISIVTTPEGAEVYERQLNFLGTTPLKGLEISLEDMRKVFQNISLRNIREVNLNITIRKDGYKEKQLILPVRLYEKNTVLNVTLDPM